MNYLIVYNTDQVSFEPNKIHESIVNLAPGTDWWHYIPNAYLVSTNLSSKQIADRIIKSLPGLLFFVTKVDLNDVNGVLHKNAWDWINNKIKKIIKIKPMNESYASQSVNLSSNPFLDYLKPTINTTELKTGSSYLDDIFKKLK